MPIGLEDGLESRGLRFEAFSGLVVFGHSRFMLTIKTLRENLLPLSPLAAIDHWLRVVEKYGESPDFENPRVGLTMRSGTQFNGYLVSGVTSPGSKERHLIVSLVLKTDTDQGRDIVYLNFNDIETVTFFDIDHVLQYFSRK